MGNFGQRGRWRCDFMVNTGLEIVDTVEDTGDLRENFAPLPWLLASGGEVGGRSRGGS